MRFGINVGTRLQPSQRRRLRAAEGKCWSVSGRCRIVRIGAVFPAQHRAAAESAAFNAYLAFPPPVTPNPSFKRTASPPLNSNVSAHVLLRENGSMQLASSCFGNTRGFPASARSAVLSSSGTCGIAPAAGWQLALPLLEGSGAAPASKAPRPSVGGKPAKRPEEHRSGQFVLQAKATHSVVSRSAALVPSSVQKRTGWCSIQRANPSIKRTGSLSRFS